MRSVTQLNTPLVLWLPRCVLVACLLAGNSTHGQAAKTTRTELGTALANAESNSSDFSAVDVVLITKARAVQAIPLLEERFRGATDVDLKSSIAAGLVELGDRDSTYWNYVLEQATLAVDSNIPDPLYSESEGKSAKPRRAPRPLGPELHSWAVAHNVSSEVAAQDAAFTFPNKVLQLAVIGDPRGGPLLRKAIHSRNYLIVSFAVEGLALLQDKEAIPLIIAEIQRAPIGYQPAIAESLVYFSDAQAQSAVDRYVPKESAILARQMKAQGVGVFGEK